MLPADKFIELPLTFKVVILLIFKKVPKGLKTQMYY